MKPIVSNDLMSWPQHPAPEPVSAADDTHAGWLHCPKCHGAPRCQTAPITSSQCDLFSLAQDGIPGFRAGRERLEERTCAGYAAALPELVRKAARGGWFHALQEVIRPLPYIGHELFHLATDESMGDLVFLMDIHPGQHVLDLGCGWGTVSAAVARRGAVCHAVDGCWEHAQFTMLRCHQMGLPVRASCVGDDATLPLADQSLDACIMTPALPWLDRDDRLQTSPEQAQLAMLAQVHRVLRPGGQLCVVSGNRYALLHKPRELHSPGSRRRWPGLFPAAMQALLTRRQPMGAIAGLHGLRGYCRMFTCAGFRLLRAYALLPGPWRPRLIVPLDSSASGRLTRIGCSDACHSRTERLASRVLPMALWKHLVCGYGFLLEKQ